MSTAIRRSNASIVGIARVAIGTAVIAVLIYACILRFAAGDASPFDYFGYFTNQTSLIASIALGMTGVSRSRDGMFRS